VDTIPPICLTLYALIMDNQGSVQYAMHKFSKVIETATI